MMFRPRDCCFGLEPDLATSITSLSHVQPPSPPTSALTIRTHHTQPTRLLSSMLSRTPPAMPQPLASNPSNRSCGQRFAEALRRELIDRRLKRLLHPRKVLGTQLLAVRPRRNLLHQLRSVRLHPSEFAFRRRWDRHRLICRARPSRSRPWQRHGHSRCTPCGLAAFLPDKARHCVKSISISMSR